MYDQDLDSGGGFSGDDPRQPTPGTSPASGYGIAPPWFHGTIPPFAAGVTWQQAGPQRDPQGNIWNWNPSTSAWEQDQAPAPSPTPTPSPTPNPTTLLPPGSIGSLLQPFTQPAPGYVDPRYPNAPAFPQLPDWRSPTAAEAEKLPGYAFARDQGRQTLENSAAARGVTNTGGTLEDIIKFGDQFAGQNYQTARANSMEDFQTNVASKYLLPYQAAYNQWSVQNPQAGIDASNKNAFNWNNYLQGYNVFRSNQNDPFNKLYSMATLGAGVQ